MSRYYARAQENEGPQKATVGAKRDKPTAKKPHQSKGSMLLIGNTNK